MLTDIFCAKKVNIYLSYYICTGKMRIASVTHNCPDRDKKYFIVVFLVQLYPGFLFFCHIDSE